MSALRISLFGGVRVAHERGSSEVKATPIVQALLAYLLLYRHRAHPREVLTGLFWGDLSEDRARSCLSTALWRLRNVLEPEGVPRGTYLVTTPVGEIGFNCKSAHWLDVEIFEKEADRVLRQPVDRVDAATVAALEKGLELYKAELLEGFYDDWALQERERLRMLHLKSLAYLMRYYRHRGTYEKSLVWGQQILQHDPLREEVHREVMRLYAESGQRALAVRQYETCREILESELGIPPMEETQALYAQIVPEIDHQGLVSAAVEKPRCLPQALQQLRTAMVDLDQAREQLQQAIRLVERYADGQHQE